MALASEGDVKEYAEGADTLALNPEDVNAEAVSEAAAPEEEVSDPAAVEPGTKAEPSEPESGEQDANNNSVSESNAASSASKTESAAAAAKTESTSSASKEESNPAAATTESQQQAQQAPAAVEAAAETPAADANEPEEQNDAAASETTEEAAEQVQLVEALSPAELLAVNKEGIYVALRNAGMCHKGASSVIAVMDVASELEDPDGSLLGWTDEWKEKLDDYSGGRSSSCAYQIAFLLETLENPEEEGSHDHVKAVLMTDDATTNTDVWYFLNYYVDEVNPDNEVDIHKAFDLAEDYTEEFDPIKDTYESLGSVFDTSVVTSTSASAGGQAVADYACNFVGNPYIWGGVSLTNGADCSGFIQSVYSHFGVSLPHYSGSLRSVGVGVSAADIQPGDIVCYDGHCAIYIGNGQIVHASNSKPYPAGGIKISSNYNYRPVLAIRRIFAADAVVSTVVNSEGIDIEPVELTKPVL